MLTVVLVLFQSHWIYDYRLHLRLSVNQVTDLLNVMLFSTVYIFTTDLNIEIENSTQLNVTLRTQVKHLIVRIYLSKLNTKLYVTYYSY